MNKNEKMIYTLFLAYMSLDYMKYPGSVFTLFKEVDWWYYCQFKKSPLGLAMKELLPENEICEHYRQLDNYSEVKYLGKEPEYITKIYNRIKE